MISGTDQSYLLPSGSGIELPRQIVHEVNLIFTGQGFKCLSMIQGRDYNLPITGLGMSPCRDNLTTTRVSRLLCMISGTDQSYLLPSGSGIELPRQIVHEVNLIFTGQGFKCLSMIPRRGPNLPITGLGMSPCRDNLTTTRVSRLLCMISGTDQSYLLPSGSGIELPRQIVHEVNLIFTGQGFKCLSMIPGQRLQFTYHRVRHVPVQR